MVLHENVEVRIESDSQDWITVTNKRSGVVCRMTIAGRDIVIGNATGDLVAVIEAPMAVVAS